MLIEENRELDEAEIPPDVLIAIAEGRKIEAIRLLRERTGLGLREARRLVDALERVRGAPSPGDLPQFSEVGGARGVVVILLALFLAWALYVTLVGG
jgi:hypothetical protein